MKKLNHCHTVLSVRLPTSLLIQIMDCDESVENGLVKLRERLQVTLKKVSTEW